MALNLTTDGKLLQEDFSSLSGWTAGANWSADSSKPCYVGWASDQVLLPNGTATNNLLASLTGYWALGEASGNRADSHGSLTLTDFNTVGSGAGAVGTAADFEASNSEYLSAADSAAVSAGDTAFTIQVGVKLESKPGTMVIVGKWNSGTNREYLIYYDGGADRFAFAVNNGVSFGGVTATNLGSPSTGTNYLIHGWHDPVNNIIGISVNAGTANTASHSAGVADTTEPFTLGRNDDGATNYYDGLQQHVAFWRRVLTATDRTTIYNSGTWLTYGDYELNDPDAGGLREPHMLRDDNGRLWLFYDAGDGGPVAGTTTANDASWRVMQAYSDDGGQNWTRLYDVQGITNGSHVARCMGGFIFHEPNDDKWYLYTINAGDQTAEAIPDVPYNGSIYSADTIDGTYTFVRDTPALGGSGTFDEDSVYFGWVLYDGAQWIGYYSAKKVGAGNQYQVGRATAATASGSYTKDGGGAIIHTDLIHETDGSTPENPKVWESAALSKWAMMVNTLRLSLNRADGADIFYAAAENGWEDSGAYRVRCISVGPDGTDAIGVTAPITDQGGDVIVESDGAIGIVYDADPGTASQPAINLNRRIRQGLIEPAVSSAKFTAPSPGSDAAEYLLQALAHTDIVIEFAVEWQDTTGSINDLGVWFRKDSTTSDTGADGYLVNLHPLTSSKVQLYECVNGSFSLIQEGSARTPRVNLTAKNLQYERVRIECIGTAIKVYVEGVEHISTTDATFGSGTHIGFRATGSVCRIRQLSMRTGTDVEVSGCGASANVVLRGPAGVIFDVATADGSGDATLSSDHYPLHSIEIDGTDYPVSGGVWGGSVFALTVAGANRSLALLGVGA